MSDLANRAARGALWNYAGIIARAMLQFVVQIALARILGPDVFGLFALAFIVIGIGVLFSDLGLGAAVVQRREISTELLCKVQAISVLAGTALTASCVVGAPWMAVAFNESRLTTVMIALAPCFLLHSLAVTPTSALKRELRFRELQAITVGSYALGFGVVGVATAFYGLGVWSLVASWLTYYSLVAIAATRIYPVPLRLCHGRLDAPMRKFSLHVSLTNIANWSVENLDNLIVGKRFGAETLGHYAAAYNLLRSPANQLVSALQTTLFSVAARAQDNRVLLRLGYLSSLACVGLLAGPLFLGAATVAETIVYALFGHAWAPAAGPLQALAVAMLFHCLMALSGPVIWGAGRVRLELWVQSATAAILVAVIWAASQKSVTAVAWAVAAVYLLRCFALMAVLCRLLQIPIADIAHALRGGAIVTMILIAQLSLLDAALQSTSPASRLAAELASSAAVLLIGLIVAPRMLLSAPAVDFLLPILSERGARWRAMTWWLNKLSKGRRAD